MKTEKTEIISLETARRIRQADYRIRQLVRGLLRVTDTDNLWGFPVTRHQLSKTRSLLGMDDGRLDRMTKRNRSRDGLIKLYTGFKRSY